ncbi:glycoprotease family-domain-containing protein [Xylariales sp. PMI_506]|nr:glycoprotease family-domain-containing protein [Xylariales sp. PMI_506]
MLVVLLGRAGMLGSSPSSFDSSNTCRIAILDKDPITGAAELLYNEKVTSDNRDWKGVHPQEAALGHMQNLAPLLREALGALPLAGESSANKPLSEEENKKKIIWIDGTARRKPDLVAATRGPGMGACLASGLAAAKGLAVAWDVPLMSVHHMQAHALTPRLVSALARGVQQSRAPQMTGQAEGTSKGQEKKINTSAVPSEPLTPEFPFLSLLVSGGHTLLVHSRSLTEHEILAQAANIAIGDMLDKCARHIIPEAVLLGAEDVMYARVLERFVFGDAGGSAPLQYDYAAPARRSDEVEIFDSGAGWSLTPPLSGSRAMAYDFSGLCGQVQQVSATLRADDVAGRQLLGRHAMRLAFEHLTSRLLLFLGTTTSTTSNTTKRGGAAARREGEKKEKGINTVVLAGGVAGNRYLVHILESMLRARGHDRVSIVAPPPALCTDNAAMIAWTGTEMFEAGWRSGLGALARPRWPLTLDGGRNGILHGDELYARASGEEAAGKI